MTENKNLSLLKFALGYFAITTLVYGIGLMFFTEKLIEMSGTGSFEPNWIRCVITHLLHGRRGLRAGRGHRRS